jgi:predicted cobalt transporter CbtA
MLYRVPFLSHHGPLHDEVAAHPAQAEIGRPRSVSTVLQAMLLAGLLAGAGLAAFQAIATEQIVDHALAFEVTASGLDVDPAPLVWRQRQKLELMAFALLYGLAVGVIFGGAYYLSQDGLPTPRHFTNALFLALAAYWAVGLFPFLKYPSNPPGVGLPSTIEYRQALYLSFTLLSLAGGLVAANVARYVDERRPVAIGYALYAALLYILMPGNPDPIHIPMWIVTSFRLLSLAGLTLFWLTLGLAFGLLLERLEPDRPRSVGA